jgi:hypothetical protein
MRALCIAAFGISMLSVSNADQARSRWKDGEIPGDVNRPARAFCGRFKLQGRPTAWSVRYLAAAEALLYHRK